MLLCCPCPGATYVQEHERLPYCSFSPFSVFFFSLFPPPPQDGLGLAVGL